MAKRALLIGINKYQIPGADLRGCVNDVKDMVAALVEFHGFKKSDITVLTDGAATKKAMQAGIKALVRDSKKGDVAVLHYSGHGSNVPDDNGDEADGRDEILCPTDLNWDDPLRDDWLRSTFDGLKTGVSFTAIMDCCHSGTNTRAILPPDAPVKERYLPSPSSLKAVESGRGLPKKVTSELRALAACRAQDQRPRQRGSARSAHHGVPRHPDVGGRLHQRPVQRGADVRARRGDSQDQGPAHLSGSARPRLVCAQDEEVRSGAAARRPDGPIQAAVVLGVDIRGCDEGVIRAAVEAASSSACGSGQIGHRGPRGQGHGGRSCAGPAHLRGAGRAVREGADRAGPDRDAGAGRGIESQLRSGGRSLSLHERQAGLERPDGCLGRHRHGGDGARSRMGRAVEEVPGQAARPAAVDDGQGMRQLLSRPAAWRPSGPPRRRGSAGQT